MSASIPAATAPHRTFLTAQWRALVMANFAVDPAVLAPLVPEGTELDSFDGRTLMSVVGFRFLETRVLGVRVPFHADFNEVNLRFYVRRRVGAAVRRAVVFVKEIVPRRAIEWIANTIYGEHYVTLPMRHTVELPGRVAYEWRHRGRWNRLAATAVGEPQPVAAGSEEEFITEHYWGYAQRPGRPTVEYQVEHPRWRAWRVAPAAVEFDVDAESLYGSNFAPALRLAPTSVLIADGSAVVVRAGAAMTVR